jgi:hypothetical protein
MSTHINTRDASQVLCGLTHEQVLEQHGAWVSLGEAKRAYCSGHLGRDVNCLDCLDAFRRGEFESRRTPDVFRL